MNENENGESLLDLARSYLAGEIELPPELDSLPEVRRIILTSVPEAEMPIRRFEREKQEEGLEQGAVFPISISEIVRILSDILWAALDRGDDATAVRCLDATEELLDHPSEHVQEVVVDQIVDGLKLCHPSSRALWGRNVRSRMGIHGEGD